MKRLRGFRIAHRLVKIFKWILRPRRIKPDSTLKCGSPRARIFSIGRCLRRVANRLCSKPCPAQIRLGGQKKPTDVPKGHLAVYVGESDCDTSRMIVPVVYFNHPLFGDLLKESVRVFGFDHPGRIMIPCRVSDFEKVRMRIATWDSCRRKPIYRRS